MEDATDVLQVKKSGMSLLTILLVLGIFYFAQHILIPLLFSILLATLLLPAIRFLQRLKVGRKLAIVLVLLAALAISLSIVYFMASQLAAFLKDWPAIETRLLFLLDSIKTWLYQKFDIALLDQEEYITDALDNIHHSENGGILGETLFTLKGAVSYLIFLPAYTFMILLYRDLIRQFIVDIFKSSGVEKVTDVLNESLLISRRYITALLIEMGIFFSVIAIGFFFLGVRYALFMALLVCLLNLIPYIGILIGGILCLLITLISGTSTGEVFLVGMVILGAHILDASVLLPVFVGSKVRVNALAIILGVLLGGTLFGIFGMFLAIPGLAVMKVMLDRIEGMEPYGRLLGDLTSQPPADETKINPPS